jgi:hypothetical protein
MANPFQEALRQIVDVLVAEEIEYMIVGGFAVSYHNRARTTNDIDMVIRIQPEDVGRILKHFPLWEAYESSFQEDIKKGIVFNIVEYEVGMRYDFMPFQDTEFGRTAFKRRQKVQYYGVECMIASREDLIISKIRWHNISPSKKQMEDLQFLLKDETLDISYLERWVNELNLDTYGLLG